MWRELPSTLALALTGGSVTGGSVVVERGDVMGVAIVVNSVEKFHFLSLPFLPPP